MAQLTPEQQARIKQILDDYHKKVEALVTSYKTDVLNAIKELDRQKAEQLEKLIQSFQ